MAENLGMGVLIGMLSGNEESAATLSAALGKRITSVLLAADALHFTMDDGSRFRVLDDGQSCCESRWMVTDDDLAYRVGATLVGMETKDAPNAPSENGEHEVQFLDVTTSRGVFQMATHNEHNGYYGGFLLRVVPEP